MTSIAERRALADSVKIYSDMHGILGIALDESLDDIERLRALLRQTNHPHMEVLDDGPLRHAPDCLRCAIDKELGQ